MPRATWPLRHDSPIIQIVLTSVWADPICLDVLADTGAGSATAPFDFMLDQADCLLCGRQSTSFVLLSGAYTGQFPLFIVRIQIPALGFDDDVPVVGVPFLPQGFDGIAGMAFLNRFTYGNFGNPKEFGLES